MMRITGSEEDARDLKQEAFIKAYHGLRQFRPEFRFFSWLYRIAINEAIDFLRKRKEAMPLSRYGDTPEVNDDSEDALRAGLLRKAILKLSVKYRILIIMKFYSNMKSDIQNHFAQNTTVTTSPSEKRAWQMMPANGWTRMALAFAAGALVGLFLLSPAVREFTTHPFTVDDTQGTIRDIGPNAMRLDKVSLPGVFIRIGNQPIGRYAQLLRLIVDAAIPVEIRLHPLQSGIGFHNISLKNAGAGNSRLTRDNDGITINVEGKQEVVITVEVSEPNTAGLLMRIADHERLLMEKKIDLN
jgi:RNA polymerase sigma factor (sigma-70 family)